jgi:hypothetical protein
MGSLDQIDSMIVNEVLAIRAQTNKARKRLGLPKRDYRGEVILQEGPHLLQEHNSNH